VALSLSPNMLTIDQHELLRTAAGAVYKSHLTSKLSETCVYLASKTIESTAKALRAALARSRRSPQAS